MSRQPPMLRLIQTATAASRNKTPHIARRYNLQISCRVKPNVSGNREGIAAVGPEKVDVCVAAVPRNGEANAAVARVFAQVFNVAKSDVGVISGLRSRDKVLNISDLDIGKESEEEFLRRARQQLEDAVV
ncbi:YggU family protein [Aspergillus granulosus]|uniref:YggU family protein n=1 Tax=Aspergillus granulosus TaxID=176169 RepID=A0ABR4HHG9_9EURO